MATNRKSVYKSKKENKYHSSMTKLLASMILYILVMIFLNFNFLNGKISAFLEEKLFHNGDIKNTISSISEMYNDKVVPVLNNFNDADD